MARASGPRGEATGAVEECSYSPQNSRSFVSRVGIDKVALWFPTKPAGFATKSLKVHGADVHIFVRLDQCGIEFNPSRVHDPGGVRLSDVQQARNHIEEVWDVIRPVVQPHADLAQSRLTRVDFARDFSGAIEPARIIEAQRNTFRPYGGDPDVRGYAGAANYLRVGSYWKRSIALYDKTHESKGRVAPGTLRYEVRYRTRGLSGFDVRKFGDLTDDRIDRMVEESWRWAGMDKPVTTLHSFADEIDRLELTDAIKAGLFWTIFQASRGRMPNSYRRQQLKDLIPEHGVLIPDETFTSPDPGLTEQLIWEAGAVKTTLHPGDGRESWS